MYSRHDFIMYLWCWKTCYNETIEAVKSSCHIKGYEVLKTSTRPWNVSDRFRCWYFPIWLIASSVFPTRCDSFVSQWKHVHCRQKGCERVDTCYIFSFYVLSYGYKNSIRWNVESHEKGKTLHWITTICANTFRVVWILPDSRVRT